MNCVKTHFRPLLVPSSLISLGFSIPLIEWQTINGCQHCKLGSTMKNGGRDSGLIFCSSSQPPTGMPTGMQSSGHSLNSIPALMGRNNSYNSYALQRGIGNIGLPLGMNDLSRSHGYPGTPRTLDGGMDRSQNNMYQQPIVESSQRSQPQVEAPPFDDTTVLHTIVAECGGQYQTVKPDVQAKMGRGPFPAEGKWTCYRRNYFAVTCGFGLNPWPPTASLYIRYPDQTLEPIRGFSMAISAIVNGQYGETRELVQHTPKRDKQSERKPGRVVLQPAPPPSFTATSTVNGNLSGFPLGSQSMDYSSSYAGTPQPCQPPTSHVFERIQFQKATANNGKRRAQQQYYNLVVELYAEVASSVPGETEWIQIARRHSPWSSADVPPVTTRTDAGAARAVWDRMGLAETAAVSFLTDWAKRVVHTCSCTTRLIEVDFLTADRITGK